MKYELENRLNDCIRTVEKKFDGSSSYASLQEASRLFDSLVEKGVTQRRGNNLLLLSNGQIFVSFNI